MVILVGWEEDHKCSGHQAYLWDIEGNAPLVSLLGVMLPLTSPPALCFDESAALVALGGEGDGVPRLLVFQAHSGVVFAHARIPCVGTGLGLCRPVFPSGCLTLSGGLAGVGKSSAKGQKDGPICLVFGWPFDAVGHASHSLRSRNNYHFLLISAR